MPERSEREHGEVVRGCGVAMMAVFTKTATDAIPTRSTRLSMSSATCL